MFIHRKDQEKVFFGKRIIGEKFWSGIKKSGKIFGRVMKSRGKIWSGKNLVGEKFRHPFKNLVTFPRLFFPDKVLFSWKSKPVRNDLGGVSSVFF